MQVTKEEIGRLLPHGESMCLLDDVEVWDETIIRCRTATHRQHDHPLRFRGKLTASAGLEYAAQAMGAHVGLSSRGPRTEAPVGYVGSVRDVVFSVSRLDDLSGNLIIEASRIAEGADSYMYRFTISHCGRALIEGRAAIFLQTTAS
jgi:predicted hotdog family 3-hydroxylacyl-ACP dehydratase